ncbi:MAG: hypothetical protein WB822_23330 [Rhodoplanes sp.]
MDLDEHKIVISGATCVPFIAISSLAPHDDGPECCQNPQMPAVSPQQSRSSGECQVQVIFDNYCHEKHRASAQRVADQQRVGLRAPQQILEGFK